MKRSLRALAALSLMLALSPAFAQITAVPQQMNFSGRLAKPDGTPVPDGNYSIRFSLWTAASGGVEKWNQTVNPVMVKNGTFSVPLNTSTGAADKFNGNLFLEIKIGTAAPLTPRQPLASVAYAMKADNAIKADGVKDNSVTSASIVNGTITSADLAANTLNSLSWLLNGNANPAANSFLGTKTNHPLDLRVNNHRAMRYSYAEDASDPDFSYRSINVLGGSEANTIGAGIIGSTIAGGGRDNFTGEDSPNSIFEDFGAIGGGFGNTVNFYIGTIAGGLDNTVDGPAGSVGGGWLNNAGGGFGATVGGGLLNIASNTYATIPGGRMNIAAGFSSFAAGNNAQALHDGSFVWGDTSDLTTPIASTAPNQFTVRANGGINLLAGNDQFYLRANNGIILDGYTRVKDTIMYIDYGLTVDNKNAGSGFADGIRFGNSSGESIASRRTAGDNQWGLDFYTAFQPRMSIANWGGVGIGTTAPQFTLDVNGSFHSSEPYFSNLPHGDRRNLQWDSSSGRVYYDDSTRKHKENITPLKEDFFKLLEAQPVTYTRPGDPNRWEIGFIAEDFDALGLKRLVDYGTDGKTPEGINYEKICLYLTAIAKQQDQRLKALEAENVELRALKAEMAELKALVQQKADQK